VCGKAGAGEAAGAVKVLVQLGAAENACYWEDARCTGSAGAGAVWSVWVRCGGGTMTLTLSTAGSNMATTATSDG
jgi:hypothetical protein